MKRTYYPDFFKGQEKEKWYIHVYSDTFLWVFFFFFTLIYSDLRLFFYLLGGGGYNTQVFRVIISLGMNCINMS